MATEMPTATGDPSVTRLFDARGSLAPDQVKARLEAEIERQCDHSISYWPIFLLAGGAHVGCCGLRPHEENVPELGVHLRFEHWGRGLATEAALTVISFAFDTLGVTALFTGHHPENHASRRLLERLGFTYTHDELYPPTGLRHPSYLLGRSSE